MLVGGTQSAGSTDDIWIPFDLVQVSDESHHVYVQGKLDFCDANPEIPSVNRFDHYT